MKQKQIVIVGAGFGGIAAAKALSKFGDQFDITVIDQNDHHVIHGNLYEVAAAPEEITNLTELYQSITLKYTDIFFGSKINFIQAKVAEINSDNQEVVFEGGTLHYDYVIAGFGAGPNFYHIEGAEQFAIPLQSAKDALRIRNQIEFAVETKRLHGKGERVRVVIAGGGVAGVELAAQLQTMLDFVAWKNKLARNNIETVIVEGASHLMPGFPDKVVSAVTNRLKDFGVDIQTHQLVTKVDQHFVELQSGDKFAYDCLVWAAGVAAKPLPVVPEVTPGRGGRIDVDNSFCPALHNNMFIIGDQCCFLDSSHTPLPGTASQAIDQGKYVASAIKDLADGRKVRAHQCKKFPYAIPLGPRWTLYTNGKYLFTGIIGHYMREWVWLKYYISILGTFKGWNFYNFTKRVFEKDLP